jgi:hypothetical protein
VVSVHSIEVAVLIGGLRHADRQAAPGHSPRPWVTRRCESATIYRERRAATPTKT